MHASTFKMSGSYAVYEPRDTAVGGRSPLRLGRGKATPSGNTGLSRTRFRRRVVVVVVVLVLVAGLRLLRRFGGRCRRGRCRADCFIRSVVQRLPLPSADAADERADEVDVRVVIVHRLEVLLGQVDSLLLRQLKIVFSWNDG